MSAIRASILSLAKDPNLGNMLFDRKDAVYARGLPGYGVKGKDVADAEYFTIGPDKQLDAWEAYLKNAEGADTKLYRYCLLVDALTVTNAFGDSTFV